MNIAEIIQKHSLVVRCLPFEVINHWSYREGDELRLQENQSIVTLPKYGDRKFVKEIIHVEKAGWFYVKQVKNTSSTVRFNRETDKYFAPTLEEALQMFLNENNF